MKTRLTLFFFAFFVLSVSANHDYESLVKHFKVGDLKVESIGVLEFGPQGILFVGDAIAGKVLAIDTKDNVKNDSTKAFALEDVETKLGSLLGTTPDGVLIHDLAVNPISQNIYLAVSRGDASKLGFWVQANDLNYGNILVKIDPKGNVSEFPLTNVSYDEATIPKPIKSGTKNWRKSDKRTEAITDIAYDDGKLYVTGLSNEEFASAISILDFPFSKENSASFNTLEVWHVAHGESETEAPVRTLIPYEINGKKHLIATYTCTPLVTFPVDELQAGKHVKVKTIGEFGYGNMPIDIIAYESEGKPYLLMSNSSKALIRIDPEEIKNAPELTEPLDKGQYKVGVAHNDLSRVGITHMDNLNAQHVLVLQRMPNGDLTLRTYPTKWL